MAATAVDFLLEDLKQIVSYSFHFILAQKDEIESLYGKLEFIRAFLNDSEDKWNEHEELKKLAAQIRDVACKALDVTDSFLAVQMVNLSTDKFDTYSVFLDKSHGKDRSLWEYTFVKPPKIRNFIDEIKSIKKAVMGIYNKKLYGIGLQQEVEPSSTTESLSRSSSPILEDDEETVVGFDDEAMMLMERLVGGREQLEVISIVGMGGIGKTTLARKVYNDPYIMHHFYIRGWTFVSQVYRKTDVLLRILSCIVENDDEVYYSSEETLGQELYKRLKGRPYLIVIDDIWNIGAWEDLKKSFPNDGNGSRIILTTRLRDMALQIKPNSPPLCLPFLSQDESWDLLQQKVFRKGSCCPPDLMDIGKQIVVKCRGLPLAIDVVAGILAKKEKKQEWWKQVAESVSLNIAKDDEKQFMGILALSYEHLPHHLKSCFLYFGAFPKDYEIPLWMLIKLWIAEGFVQPMGQRSLENVANWRKKLKGFVQKMSQRSLEDIAEDYLKDLIDRSLVVVSKKSSKGGVKACRVHDMLHDLCLRKVKENHFLDQIDCYERVVSPSTPVLNSCKCFSSLSGKPCAAHRRHFLFSTYPKHFISFFYKLLRVLDLGCIYPDNFPNEILRLFHLRYLKLHVPNLDSLPSQISNLWNLETLIIDKGERGAVTLPLTVWDMQKLRHIRIKDGIEFEKPRANHGCASVLCSLQSISALHFPHSRKNTNIILSRTPNLRKLVLSRGQGDSGDFLLPDLSTLVYLDTLKLIDNSWKGPRPSVPQPSKFPPNMKKLTLIGGRVEWENISNVGKLPKLEVLKVGRSFFEHLKLRPNFFAGLRWETSDGEFRRLKYLKLSSIGLEQWITSSCHFPILQRLVLDGCMDLEEIPSCLGYIHTLQTIEIYCSSDSLATSAMKIQEEQHQEGNHGLKISIFPKYEDDEGDLNEEEVF